MRPPRARQEERRNQRPSKTRESDLRVTARSVDRILTGSLERIVWLVVERVGAKMDLRSVGAVAMAYIVAWGLFLAVPFIV